MTTKDKLQTNQTSELIVPIQQGFLSTLLRDLSFTDLRVFLYLYSKFYSLGVSTKILPINEIVKDSGFKRDTVIRGLNSLDEQGYVHREKRQSKTEGYLPSRLTIPILRDSKL